MELKNAKATEIRCVILLKIVYVTFEFPDLQHNVDKTQPVRAKSVTHQRFLDLWHKNKKQFIRKN